jgi:hypothetical protein
MAERQDLYVEFDYRQLKELLAQYIFENSPHSNNRTKWKPTWKGIGCNVRGTWRKKAEVVLKDVKSNGHTIGRVRSFVCARIRNIETSPKYKINPVSVVEDVIERANLEGQRNIALTIKGIIGGKT